MGSASAHHTSQTDGAIQQPIQLNVTNIPEAHICLHTEQRIYRTVVRFSWSGLEHEPTIFGVEDGNGPGNPKQVIERLKLAGRRENRE